MNFKLDSNNTFADAKSNTRRNFDKIYHTSLGYDSISYSYFENCSQRSINTFKTILGVSQFRLARLRFINLQRLTTDWSSI